MREERCLSCGKILFRRVRVDEVGHTVVQADISIELEGDGFERFYRCPACHAMHVLSNKKNEFGIPQLVISHMKLPAENET